MVTPLQSGHIVMSPIGRYDMMMMYMIRAGAQD